MKQFLPALAIIAMIVGTLGILALVEEVVDVHLLEDIKRDFL